MKTLKVLENAIRAQSFCGSVASKVHREFSVNYAYKGFCNQHHNHGRSIQKKMETQKDPQASILSHQTQISWERIDKTKFHVLGAGLFSAVSAVLHPISVVKTRIQVAEAKSVSTTAFGIFKNILKADGVRGLYRGFGTSVVGSIPGRSMFLVTLEVSKEYVFRLISHLNLPDATRTAISNGAAGLISSLLSEIYYVPLDVVTQRLMVQGLPGVAKYSGGVDTFRRILQTEGILGLYRGFGMSILTYCPSAAVWWGAYGTSQHVIWRTLGYDDAVNTQCPSQGLLVSVQAVGGVVAGASSSVITTPLDTIKTRLQVLENKEGCSPTVSRTVKVLWNDDGWKGFYRGLEPRFLSMSLWGTSMIVTYEFLKRLSVRPLESD